MQRGRAKNVVIALGNRLRGDDGVGPFVADRLEDCRAEVTVIEGPLDPLQIMIAWANASLTVVVDAAASGAPAGTVHRLVVDSKPLPKQLARCSSHGLGLVEALEMGRVLGHLPSRLVIFAVEAKAFERGAPLSPEVAEAGEMVVRDVEAEIASFASA